MKSQQQASHYWLFDSRSNSRRSPWLQSTLAELEKNTEAMLKLIQEDADSFAQRAEMYYKKRPQLIGMEDETPVDKVTEDKVSNGVSDDEASKSHAPIVAL
ncbi:hypothetical protein M0R45_011084 [Rubus argutus]|uniref:NAB domain-containing protein n=1 Tax=Rubus argutus TaxID=59490 RepID=A0AAW1Y9Z7_RUBAR